MSTNTSSLDMPNQPAVAEANVLEDVPPDILAALWLSDSTSWSPFPVFTEEIKWHVSGVITGVGADWGEPAEPKPTGTWAVNNALSLAPIPWVVHWGTGNQGTTLIPVEWTLLRWSVVNMESTAVVENLEKFQADLMSSDKLYALVELLHAHPSFLGRIAFFWSSSIVDALTRHTGTVKIRSKKWEYSLIQEWDWIIFMNWHDKIRVQNAVPDEVVRILMSIEDFQWPEESKLYNAIHNVGIAGVTIGRQITKRSTLYDGENKVEKWRDTVTDEVISYFPLSIWNIQYFVWNTNDGGIFLRNSQGNRIGFYRNETMCINAIRELSDSFATRSLMWDALNNTPLETPAFDFDPHVIAEAMREKDEKFAKYILGIDYILQHIRMYTKYLKMDNIDVATKSTILSHVGALYLILLQFYNPWIRGKDVQDPTYFDGLVQNLCSLRDIQKERKSWLLPAIKATVVSMLSKIHITAWASSWDDDSIQDFWVWLPLNIGDSTLEYIRYQFRLFQKEIYRKNIEIPKNNASALLRSLSLGKDAIIAEYARRLHTNWEVFQTTQRDEWEIDWELIQETGFLDTQGASVETWSDSDELSRIWVTRDQVWVWSWGDGLPVAWLVQEVEITTPEQQLAVEIEGITTTWATATWKSQDQPSAIPITLASWQLVPDSVRKSPNLKEWNNALNWASGMVDYTKLPFDIASILLRAHTAASRARDRKNANL